jgi:hypothetical protein
MAGRRPGHPRPCGIKKAKTWMAATSAGITRRLPLASIERYAVAHRHRLGGHVGIVDQQHHGARDLFRLSVFVAIDALTRPPIFLFDQVRDAATLNSLCQAHRGYTFFPRRFFSNNGHLRIDRRRKSDDKRVRAGPSFRRID